MRAFSRRPCAFVFIWNLLGCAVAIGVATPVAANQFVRLDYNLTLNNRARDTVFIEVFDDKPLSRDNFMQYVNGGKYDETIMHRLARNFVLQGGGYYLELVDEPPPVNVSLDPNAKVDLDGNPATANPTVLNEYNVAPIRSNLRGTISFAKVGPPAGQQPTPATINSATNQWFVNLVNNQSLDTNNGGFTVFARVAGDGMALFDAFNSLSIANLNPDLNDDGIRDPGFPFFNSSSDGVPFLNGPDDLLVVLEDAERIDYFGAGSTTDIPAAGLVVAARDAFIDTGAAFTGTGSVTVGAGRTLGIREGITLNRPLVNQGILAPGQQVGSINLSSFQQSVAGALNIQLKGDAIDTEFDRVVVSGAATLAGTLNVSLIGGFTPAAGDSFTVLTAGSITGAFNQIVVPELAPGFVWSKLVTPTSLTLSVEPDFQTDGVINSADFAAWKNRFGEPGTNLTDGEDFLGWQRNFGKTFTPTATAAASAVPEPGTVAMLAAGLAAIAAARRRIYDV